MGENYKEFSSYFVAEKAIFGSFPTHDRAEMLKNMGVKYFVILTEEGEVKDPYYLNPGFTGSWINFAIPDRSVPNDLIKFTALINLLLKTIAKLSDEERIYIHCKGGHGRAGIVVAVLLAIINKIYTQDAITLTTKYHNERTVMREKWRKVGSPQTRSQKMYVHHFLSDMVFFRAYKIGPSNGFSTYSEHKIKVPAESTICLQGVYPTSEALFQACKNPGDKNYVEKLKKSKNPTASRKIGEKMIPHETWDPVTLMKKILRLKFDQHPVIKKNLLLTGKRRIIFNSRKDLVFGIGPTGNGQNKLGEILMELREEFLDGKQEWQRF